MTEFPKNSSVPAPPIDHPRLNGLMGINKSQKKNRKTCRFMLDLFKPDDKKFPEFNYAKLLKKEKKISDTDGDGGFPESDDDSKLEALARKFEQKYGSSKKKGLQDFIDVGYGYDESDPFLDNSEAYDEVVPLDWTTEHDGFYINQGDLDFKPISPDKLVTDDSSSLLLSSKKKKKKKPQLKPTKELSTQKKKKQLLKKEKQRKRQECLLKAQKILNKKKKKKASVSIVNDENSQDTPLALLNKSNDDDIPLSKIVKDSAPSKAQKKQNILQKSKPVLITSTNNNNNTITDTNIRNAPNLAGTAKTEGNPSPKIEAGPDKKPELSGTDSPKPNLKVETPLPENLAKELLEDVARLKQTATDKTKGKFFTPEVNKILVSFATRCRKLSPKIRNVVYDHILYYLPCAKDTLVKRCRALVVQHQRDLEDQPMQNLQKAINASMPEQQKTFAEELEKALQEQAREQIKQTGVDPKNTNETESNEGEDKAKKIPKKKYNWPANVKALLLEVVGIRVGLYKMSKSKSITAEEFIKDFLESEIRKMWPKGWMTSRILYRESRSAHSEITQPSAKGKKNIKKEVTMSPNSEIKIPVPNVDTKRPLPNTTKESFLSNQTVSTTPATTSSVQTLITTLSNTKTTSSVQTLITTLSNTKTTSSVQTLITTLSNTKTSVASTVNSSIKSPSPGSIRAILSDSRKPSITTISVPVYSSISNTISSSNTQNKTIIINKYTTSIMNKLPSNLKIVTNSKSLGQNNARFIAAIEKSTFMNSPNGKSLNSATVHLPVVFQSTPKVTSTSGNQILFSNPKSNKVTVEKLIANTKPNSNSVATVMSAKLDMSKNMDERNIGAIKTKQVKRKSSTSVDESSMDQVSKISRSLLDRESIDKKRMYLQDDIKPFNNAFINTTAALSKSSTSFRTPTCTLSRTPAAIKVPQFPHPSITSTTFSGYVTMPSSHVVVHHGESTKLPETAKMSAFGKVSKNLQNSQNSLQYTKATPQKINKNATSPQSCTSLRNQDSPHGVEGQRQSPQNLVSQFSTIPKLINPGPLPQRNLNRGISPTNLLNQHSPQKAAEQRASPQRAANQINSIRTSPISQITQHNIHSQQSSPQKVSILSHTQNNQAVITTPTFISNQKTNQQIAVSSRPVHPASRLKQTSPKLQGSLTKAQAAALFELNSRQASSEISSSIERHSGHPSVMLKHQLNHPYSSPQTAALMLNQGAHLSHPNLQVGMYDTNRSIQSISSHLPINQAALAYQASSNSGLNIESSSLQSSMNLQSGTSIYRAQDASLMQNNVPNSLQRLSIKEELELRQREILRKRAASGAGDTDYPIPYLEFD